MIDGISALMIFCKSPELKAQGQFNHLTPMSDLDRITLYNFKQTFFFVTHLWQEKKSFSRVTRLYEAVVVS